MEARQLLLSGLPRLRCRLSASIAVLFASTPLVKAQTAPANLVTVDATAPISAPKTGYLHLAGVSSNGRSLQVNSRYLVLDGKPWLPVMGDPLRPRARVAVGGRDLEDAGCGPR